MQAWRAILLAAVGIVAGTWAGCRDEETAPTQSPGTDLTTESSEATEADVEAELMELLGDQGFEGRGDTFSTRGDGCRPIDSIPPPPPCCQIETILLGDRLDRRGASIDVVLADDRSYGVVFDAIFGYPNQCREELVQVLDGAVGSSTTKLGHRGFENDLIIPVPTYGLGDELEHAGPLVGTLVAIPDRIAAGETVRVKVRNAGRLAMDFGLGFRVQRRTGEGWTDVFGRGLVFDVGLGAQPETTVGPKYGESLIDELVVPARAGSGVYRILKSVEGVTGQRPRPTLVLEDKFSVR